MNYLERDTYGMYTNNVDSGPGPRLMGAYTLIGDNVYNADDEHLGNIKEIMLDVQTGKIAYAVMSFGGVFSIGEKLFAVPWSSLKLDPGNKRFVLNIGIDRFKNAPGFDSDNWPNMADQAWVDGIRTYYDASTH